MKRLILLGLLVGCSLWAAGCGRTDDSAHFATEAAQGGMAEVQLGGLAAARGSNPAVRQFGQQMVADHSKANAELVQVATGKGLQLPTQVTAEQKAEMEKLAQLSGADFDREYVTYMVADHEEDVAHFQRQADSGGDSDVKAFAARTLPVIQGHLRMIKDIKAKL